MRSSPIPNQPGLPIEFSGDLQKEAEMDRICRKWFWRGMISGSALLMIQRCIKEGGRPRYWGVERVKEWLCEERQRIREAKDEKQLVRLFTAIRWAMSNRDPSPEAPEQWFSMQIGYPDDGTNPASGSISEKKDHFSKLPNCVLLLIALNLDLEDLKPLLRVSRYMALLLTPVLYRSTKGWPELSSAATRGDVGMIKTLIEVYGIDVNTTENGLEDDNGAALLQAVWHGRIRAVQLLLKYGALHRNHAQRFVVGEAIYYDVSPLHLAVIRGCVEIVELLLNTTSEKTRVVNEKTRRHPRTAENGHVYVLPSDYYLSPLHLAAERGYVLIVELLLKHGAEVDALDNRHQNPLLYAVRFRNEEVVSTFLRRGGSISCTNVDGDTALFLAVKNEQEHMVSLLLRNCQVEWLEPSFLGEPLVEAAGAGNHAITRLLVSAGAAMNYYSHKKGRTAMQNAVYNGKPAILGTLFRLGTPSDPKCRFEELDKALSQAGLSADANRAKPEEKQFKSCILTLFALGADLENSLKVLKDEGRFAFKYGTSRVVKIQGAILMGKLRLLS